MCGTCGCGEGETTFEGEHRHVLADGTVIVHGHDHVHDHDHDHHHDHDHDHGHGHGHEHGHEDHEHEPSSRLIAVEEALLAENDRVAGENRARFQRGQTFVLNLMSSPGSGKTTLLVELLRRLRGSMPLAVIEGDQQTSNDAERIRATEVPALQVNTGKGCHLDAAMVRRALTQLRLPEAGALFVENVGNLVCPAGFDLGETKRCVVVSVTEGEDKPLKYPHMFRAADLVVVNKVDLLPYLEFDVEALEANIRALAPNAEIIRVSATKGEGLDDLEHWIADARAAGVHPS